MISELATKIRERKHRIDRWYEDRLGGILNGAPPVYTSVDVRNSGFKIAVVDTNLFPSGFNNLCETFSENASRVFQNYFTQWYPSARKILIFPEEHTRNLYYWKNIAALSHILAQAGLEVQVGSASTLFASDPTVIEVDGFPSVRVKKLSLVEGRLQVEGFVPDILLINNDLSNGIPEYFKDLERQILLPSPELGWHRRKKSEHFFWGSRLIQEVSTLLDMDPWLLSPMSAVEGGINLSDEICLRRLQETADRMLDRIRQKYLEYGIQREPYLFVKNNSGTYGLGITHIRSGADLFKLSRKTRNKLEAAKGRKDISEYLLQEGIPTADLHHGKPIEPVVYLVGGEAVGTFFRIHEGKNEMENLNAPGMSFSCLCLHKYENKDDLSIVASFLGKIASLAAVLELGETYRPIALSA